mgnify:CR=1 FL=1
MYKESWGLKRICPCNRIMYYDLGRKDFECPECGKFIEVTTLLRPRRGRKPGSTNVAPLINPAPPQPEKEKKDLFIENLDLSGADRSPDLVVAPIKVNGFNFICTDLALGPESIIRSILKSSMAEYKYSSITLFSLCISSINKTSPSSKLVSRPARSPAFSSTGPDVTFKFVESSLEIIWDNVVLPRPGGPCNIT